MIRVNSFEDQLYEMKLNDTIAMNAGRDLILRVPGGWVYTVYQRPVFVPEHRPMTTCKTEAPVYGSLLYNEFEAVEKLINELEKEVPNGNELGKESTWSEKESLLGESVQSSGDIHSEAGDCTEASEIRESDEVGC